MQPFLKGTPVRAMRTEQTGGGVMVDYIHTGKVVIAVTDELVQVNSIKGHKGGSDLGELELYLSEHYEEAEVETISYEKVGADYIPYVPNLFPTEDDQLTFVDRIVKVFLTGSKPSLLVTLKNGVTLYISHTLVRISFTENGGYVHDLGVYKTDGTAMTKAEREVTLWGVKINRNGEAISNQFPFSTEAEAKRFAEKMTAQNPANECVVFSNHGHIYGA